MTGAYAVNSAGDRRTNSPSLTPRRALRKNRGPCDHAKQRAWFTSENYGKSHIEAISELRTEGCLDMSLGVRSARRQIRGERMGCGGSSEGLPRRLDCREG